MSAWIEKLQMNMSKFIVNKNTDKQEKLDFIRRQYGLFDIANKVLDGKAFFVGCSHTKEKI